ncbi:MAG: DUF3108 domain-containing protein [Bacteroidales bacterium]|nr:DUF3108 domain-containing protein [Bacteroidales bacterium]
MKLRLFLTFALLCSIALLGDAQIQSPETLHYKVMYKWGLIHKQAGTATLSIAKTADGYHTLLTAQSAPWADKFFMVRDTLIGHMSDNPAHPFRYEKIAHEGGEHKHDIVTYSYSGNKVTGDCIRKVWKKGNLTVDETRTLEAENEALDMISSFYFMRNLPFAKMKPGEKRVIPIFSGKRKETLSITYAGIEEIEIDKKKVDTYHITFTFTSKDGAKTSDDMDAWIATAPGHIPLKLEGKLPVGKVHCLLMQ